MTESEKTSEIVPSSTLELITMDISLKIMALYLKGQEIDSFVKHTTALNFDNLNEIKLRYEQYINNFFGSTDLNRYSNNGNDNRFKLYINAITEHISDILNTDKNQVNDFNLKLDYYYEELDQILHWYKCLA